MLFKQIFVSGYDNSYNLTIVTILFPMLLWLWIHPPSILVDKSTNSLNLSFSKCLKLLCPETVCPWLLGFVPSFALSITLVMSIGNDRRFLVFLLGTASVIAAYLDWKIPQFSGFRFMTPFIFGVCLAIGWNPVVKSELASILLNSLEGEWNVSLFTNAVAYSLGVGTALWVWHNIMLLVVWACKSAFLRINSKLHSIIQEGMVDSFLHLIMLMYGVLILSGLLQWIQVFLLIPMAW